VGGAAAAVSPTGRTGARAVAGGVVLVAAASVVAWALAQPLNSLAGTSTRALADCAAVVTVGLTVVPMLDSGRHRDELARAAAGPLTVAAAVWLLAELARMTVVAAQAVDVPAGRVGVPTFVEFATHTAPGRSVTFCALAAAAVWVFTAAAPRTAPWAVASAGVAGAGLAARTLSGHLAESSLGGAAVAVHALAAAVWCGALAALLVTVGHRGQWARVLPRFSRLSLVCVGALVLAGSAGAVTMLDSVGQLWTTGYGRVLCAKLALTAAVTVLAWRNRSSWLPAAVAHRATAGLSRSRSAAELAIMAVALTFAAALAVTG
jgi:copper resistance protein D